MVVHRICENNLEDLLDSGQRIDNGVSAEVTIVRPNRLRAERKGDLVNQAFYYDGKTLTLYNPEEKAYASQPAPATISGTLDYARDSCSFWMRHRNRLLNLQCIFPWCRKRTRYSGFVVVPFAGEYSGRQ